MNGYDRYLQQVESKANKGDKLSFAKSQKSFPLKNHNKTTDSVRSSKENKPKRKRKMPILSAVLSIIGFVFALWGYENHEQLEKWLNSVEVSFMTSSVAKEAPATKPSPATAQKQEQASGNTTDASEEMTTKKEETDVVDFNFIKDFQERKKQLDLKEEELKKLEAEVVAQRESIDKKLEEVEAIRKQISQQLEERVKADEQKIDTLVQVYSQMKPPQAAKVFETIDEDLAVEILTKMKKKSAADILNLLKPDRAQSLSEKYAGYKRKPASASNDLKNNEGLKNDNSTKP
jgi:flagellar motility protein MotE (MotC chaperone)